MIPVSRPGHPSRAVLHEAMLEVVEDGELVPGHDIGLGRSLDLAPYRGKGTLEDFANGGVLRAVRALAGDLKSLDY